MNRTSAFITAAVVAYISMIAFVRFHPSGREVDMLDFKTHQPTAILTSLWMLAISGLYLYATKQDDGGKTIRIGCLGLCLAIAASMIAAFADVTPESWTAIQSQRFIGNLVTVVILPFAIILVLGFRRRRVEEARPELKSHW